MNDAGILADAASGSREPCWSDAGKVQSHEGSGEAGVHQPLWSNRDKESTHYAVIDRKCEITVIAAAR